MGKMKAFLEGANNIFWRVYAAIFIFMTLVYLRDIFSPESVVYQYYHVLMAFDKNYELFYGLSAINACVTALTIVPLALFLFRIHFLPRRFWQIFFFFHLLFDITGRSYEIKTVKSYLLDNTLLASLAVLLWLFIVLPSYYALYQVAFRPKRLSPEKV